MRKTAEILKSIENNKPFTHRECLQVMRDIIETKHGVSLTVEQVGRRWRDIKEGMNVPSIESYIEEEELEDEELEDDDDDDDDDGDDEGEAWKKGKTRA